MTLFINRLYVTSLRTVDAYRLHLVLFSRLAFRWWKIANFFLPYPLFNISVQYDSRNLAVWYLV